ncbi:MAG: DUF1189 domain-containing protein [Marinisporobacter sp.]|jgi:hypothetical protein|nr:DUF1189 domain-containing protein [Marinisporobacter sp.]
MDHEMENNRDGQDCSIDLQKNIEPPLKDKEPKKKIRFFSRVVKSISDFKFYRLVQKESLGKAFLYLLILSLLIGFIGTLPPILDLNKISNQVVDYIKTNPDIPDFTFENGILEVAGDEPYIVELPEENYNNIVVIDTKEQTDRSILDDYNAGVYITRDRIIMKKSEIETKERSLSTFSFLTLTKENIQKLTSYIVLIAAGFLIIFSLIGDVMGKLVSTLLISILGLIVNAVTKANIGYKDIYKLGIYAITLPAIIQLLLNMLSLNIPFFNLIYYGIVMGYLWKIMRNIKEENLMNG